jgi:hypothetical protein
MSTKFYCDVCGKECGGFLSENGCTVHISMEYGEEREKAIAMMHYDDISYWLDCCNECAPDIAKRLHLLIKQMPPSARD